MKQSRRQFLKTLLALAGGLFWIQPPLFSKQFNPSGSFFLSAIQKPLPVGASQVVGQPGSLMKLIATVLICEEHLPVWNDPSFDCTGSYTLGNTGGNTGIWVACQHAHGNVDLQQALALSCNGFFLKASEQIRPSVFEDWFQRFFHRKPLARLPNASALLVLGLETGLTITAAELLSLMRQIAMRDQKLEISDSTWRLLQNAMQGAARYGTGKALDPKNQWRLALKTGTTLHGNTYQSWVAGYFPVEQPQFMFCVRAPVGTSQDAAIPLARYYLNAQLGNLH